MRAPWFLDLAQGHPMIVPGRKIWCEPVVRLGGINRLPIHTEYGWTDCPLDEICFHRIPRRVQIHGRVPEVFACLYRVPHYLIHARHRLNGRVVK